MKSPLQFLMFLSTLPQRMFYLDMSHPFDEIIDMKNTLGET